MRNDGCLRSPTFIESRADKEEQEQEPEIIYDERITQVSKFAKHLSSDEREPAGTLTTSALP